MTIRKFRDRLLRPVLHSQALMREDLAGLLSRLDALALVADAHRRRLDDLRNVADAHSSGGSTTWSTGSTAWGGDRRGRTVHA